MASHSLERRRSPGRLSPLFLYYALVVGIVLAGLTYLVAGHPWRPEDVEVLFWVAVIAVAELLPVPGWGGTQLTISLPLFMAVVFVFPPEIAAVIIFLGSWDPREFRREVSLGKALFNRAQSSFAIYVAGIAFHALAELESGWVELIAGALFATAIFEVLNATFVVIALRLDRNEPILKSYRDLAGGSVWEFLFFYVGLGLLGIPLARLYTDLTYGEWAVVFFLFPLLLAQQMFSRTQALMRATTELKEREKVLRQLSNRMAEERYDERRQIAGYLHDDLAQMLFRLGLQADSARSALDRSDQDKASTAIDHVEELKDQSIALVRGLIRDLDRSPLGRAGLATALASLATEASFDGRIRFHVDVTELPLSAPIQLLAYQISREAAQNAIKHADPKNVWITIQPDGAELVMTIRDDGAGFDVSAPAPEGHYGLAIMRERAVIAGGMCEVRSEPGGGTEIVVVFPEGWREDVGPMAEPSGAS